MLGGPRHQRGAYQLLIPQKCVEMIGAFLRKPYQPLIISNIKLLRNIGCNKVALFHNIVTLFHKICLK